MHVSHSCYVQNSPSHPCRMNAEYIIEICSAGECFPSADPRGKPSLTRRVSGVRATRSCTCAPAHPRQVGFLPLKIAAQFLRSAFPQCRLWLCSLWQSGARRSVFFLKPVCDVMWSICHRIPETGSPPSPGAVWVEQKALSTTLGFRLSVYLYLFIFLSVCSFCVCL